MGVMQGLFIEPVLEGEGHTIYFMPGVWIRLKVLAKGRGGKGSSGETWGKRLKNFLRMGGCK